MNDMGISRSSGLSLIRYTCRQHSTTTYHRVKRLTNPPEGQDIKRQAAANSFIPVLALTRNVLIVILLVSHRLKSRLGGE